MKKLPIFGVHHEANKLEEKNVHIVGFLSIQKAVVERGGAGGLIL
jgi:hypothetical protein